MKCPHCGSENVALLMNGYACMDCGESKPKLSPSAMAAVRELLEMEKALAKAENATQSTLGTEK